MEKVVLNKKEFYGFTIGQLLDVIKRAIDRIDKKEFKTEGLNKMSGEKLEEYIRETNILIKTALKEGNLAQIEDLITNRLYMYFPLFIPLIVLNCLKDLVEEGNNNEEV